MRWAASTKTNLSLRHPFEIHLVELDSQKVVAVNMAAVQLKSVEKVAVEAGEVLITKSGQNPFASCYKLIPYKPKKEPLLVKDGKNEMFKKVLENIVVEKSLDEAIAESSNFHHPYFIDPSLPNSIGKPVAVFSSFCLIEQPVIEVFHAPNSLRVFVHKADVLSLAVEAIAVPTDGGLGNSGGLARLIEKAAGKRLRQMINRFRDKLPGMRRLNTKNYK